MHETGRWYRHNRNRGGVRAGDVALWIIAMLIPLCAWAQGQAVMGKSLYERDCTSCHGADGRGGPMANSLPVPPRNLADRAYLQTRTAAQLFGVIKHGGNTQGLSAAMPGFGQQLSDAQIWDTVAYIRTLSAAASASRRQPAMAPESPPGNTRIQRLSVSIWPEYDDPRVLVILRGELSPESPVPTRIELPMPKGAELLGAGMISPQNELLNHPHERHMGDTSDTLELTLPGHRFFAEWYYDPFGQRSRERQWTYALTLPYAVAQLDVDILQPDAATDFRTTPAPTREDVDARGGRHYLFSYRDLEPEAPQRFEVAYIKTTDAPSITRSEALASNAQPGNAVDHVEPTGLSRRTKTWVAFAMLAGFAVIFAGGALVFGNKQPVVPPAAPGAPTVSAPIAQAAVKGPETARAAPHYCSNCGRQLQATYLFCPRCGQPLQPS